MELQKMFDVDYMTQFVQHYRKYITIGSSVLAAIIGLGIYTYFSRVNYEYSSQQALMELLLEYSRSYNTAELWNDVEVGAKTAYKQYGKSSVAPYFLFIQAEALYQQDQKSEALTQMKTAFSLINEKSPLYYLYSIKLARMLLDQDDQESKQEGLELLKKLSENNKNPQQDKALYDLAQYYENEGDRTQAEKVRDQLIGLKDSFKDMQSAWIVLAEQQRARGV